MNDRELMVELQNGWWINVAGHLVHARHPAAAERMAELVSGFEFQKQRADALALQADEWEGKYAIVSAMNERLREKLAAAYADLSGKDTHASDCATSNAPAMEPGPCDCGA